MTIDIDGFPIIVHGRQPGAAFNGQYQEIVYHPLVASYSVCRYAQQYFRRRL